MSLGLLAASSDNNVEEVLWCLQEDNDVNVRDTHGKMPLMNACSRGHQDIVEILINA